MYKAMDIAKYIATEMLCRWDNPVSNAKLQYLLYFAQVYSWKLRGKRLFEDDMIHKVFGPCVQEVYNYFCVYPDRILLKFQVDLEVEDRLFINRVLKDFGQLKFYQLNDTINDSHTYYSKVNNGEIIYLF